MLSSSIFFLSFLLYVSSFFLYIYELSREKRGIINGYNLSLIAVIIQTIGLAVRYYEAGIIEVLTFEQTMKTSLSGMARLKVMLSHPPFTNLYESMIFVVWGIAIVYLVLNKKYSLNIIGLMGSALVVLGMGLSNLLPDKSITPLVPALKSWWLHLHVITASLSYGAFLIAALVSILYLIKENTPFDKLLIVFLLITAILLLMLVSFNPAKYSLTLLGQDEAGRLKPATISLLLQGQNNPFTIPLKQPAPLIGAFAGIIIAFSIFSLIAIRIREGLKKYIPSILSSLFIIHLGLMISTTTPLNIGTDKKELADIINFTLTMAGINPNSMVNLNINIPPPYKISINSYPFQFTIISLLLLFSLFLIYLNYRYESLKDRLPSSDRLDTISYRIILFGFPMMTFVILTGAIWAHFAWGRYWGWDPKETWSLITWLIYAFYLHSRHILKWSRKRSSIIAIIGFAVVIFTYIGVNLGLTGTGLHVYGSG